MRSARVLWFVAALAACGDAGPEFVDAATGGDDAAIGVDATNDVDADTGADAGPDARSDAGSDAGMDANSGIDAGGGIDAGSGMDAGGGSDASMDANSGMDAGGGSDASMDGGSAPDAVMQQAFYWADWTSATTGLPGTASGTLTAPSGTVTITYGGELHGAQTSGGANYWLPDAPYINAVTANGPSPNTDILRVYGGSGLTNTVTFDPPVTGLVMGIVSLGQVTSNVKYAFDTDITLLSYGHGYFGNGTIVVEGTNTISGNEGHGAIQFAGTVSSVSWTIVNSENWHGFTFGIPNQ